MESDDNKNFYKQKHGINIALASQLRLHDILNRIVNLDANYPIDSPEKQKCYLSLVKQYLISAVPYLSPTDAKKYQKEVLSFSINRKSDVKKGMQKFSYRFNQKLDIRLNQILMELQQKLRHLFSKIVEDDGDEGL
jgi:hypothetical protein